MKFQKSFLIGLSATLLLSSCSLSGASSSPNPTAPSEANTASEATPDAMKPTTNPTPVVTPAPEPAFRAEFELKAEKSTIKVGEKTKVTLLINDLKEPITTLSTTLRSSGGTFSGLEVNTNNFPLSFKKDIASGQQALSLALSNQQGVQGDGVEVASFEVEGKRAGNLTLDFSSDDTSLLLRNNAEVTPKNPSPLTITVE